MGRESENVQASGLGTLCSHKYGESGQRRRMDRLSIVTAYDFLFLITLVYICRITLRATDSSNASRAGSTTRRSGRVALRL